MEEREGGGWLAFAGVMILILGVLNIIWGIAAIGGSKFFVEGQQYILTSLNTWGWVILVVGVIQVIAAFSIWAGGEFGRWVGVVGAGLSSIGALLTIPALPFWSMCVFFVDVLIMYGLLAYGGHQFRPPTGREPRAR